MASPLEFKDINFKLAVVEILMYQRGVLGEPFRIHDFAKGHPEIDVERDGYEIIPQALQYFRDLEIPAEHAASIEEIYQDGGDDIYLEICPFWDGEDDIFNIQSAEDCRMFPNLKRVDLFYDGTGEIVKKFAAENVEAGFM